MPGANIAHDVQNDCWMISPVGQESGFICEREPRMYGRHPNTKKWFSTALSLFQLQACDWNLGASFTHRNTRFYSAASPLALLRDPAVHWCQGHGARVPIIIDEDDSGALRDNSRDRPRTSKPLIEIFFLYVPISLPLSDRWGHQCHSFSNDCRSSPICNLCRCTMSVNVSLGQRDDFHDPPSNPNGRGTTACKTSLTNVFWAHIINSQINRHNP